jgi:serine/threonine protein kinase
MSSPFDPYYQWLGIPPKDQPPHLYRLLSVELFEPSSDVIAHAADRQMGHIRTFQAGPQGQHSQRILNEIATAQICLLNADKKAAYDALLRASLPAMASPAATPPPVVQPVAPPASPSETAQPTDGRALGEYVLLDQIGSGSTGQLFKAQHRTMGRIVALKILSRQAMQSRELVERFRRKIKILASLQHKNLVAAFDAGEQQGVHYLIMEYVDGKDLASLRKKYGLLPIDRAIGYFAQAAAGLGYAHLHNIVHRNVKLSNLMVNRAGVVKVIGLGIARAADERSGEELTEAGRALGTVDTMSPEQAADARAVDHRSDIYSLGCTLCSALTGKSPYPVNSPMKKVLAHRDDPIPSLRDRRGDIPESLDAVFRKMLAKLPADRYQAMDEVAAALRAAG